ncbi:13579_t:CDS:2 [Acaulospora colombiana]|uniref:13579_t:CDS:1 n=1 Tax=Acaulospora colombiana TaxID=27376 RepID=A0ACA9KET8_9GLOM|nr:13579_t:CDS:2 [Acaulospora colombiana]
MFKAIKSYAAPIWVVNFVEGTRLNPTKLKNSQQFARERGLPVLQNLLLPRTKGFVACVRQLRDTHVQYVYDITIAYRHITRGFQFPPNLIQVHACSPLTPPWLFHVHIRRYAIKDLPRDDKELSEWVQQIFVEKDSLLEDMKHRWTESASLGQVREERYFG